MQPRRAITQDDHLIDRIFSPQILRGHESRMITSSSALLKSKPFSFPFRSFSAPSSDWGGPFESRLPPSEPSSRPQLQQNQTVSARLAHPACEHRVSPLWDFA